MKSNELACVLVTRPLVGGARGRACGHVDFSRLRSCRFPQHRLPVILELCSVRSEKSAIADVVVTNYGVLFLHEHQEAVHMVQAELFLAGVYVEYCGAGQNFVGLVKRVNCTALIALQLLC